MSECPRAGKLFGCRFEARFDRPAFETKQPIQGTSAGVVKLIEEMRPKVYVRDVCVRCGKTVEREPVSDTTTVR